MRAYEKLKALPPSKEICICGHVRIKHEWILGKSENHRCYECDCKSYDQVGKNLYLE